MLMGFLAFAMLFPERMIAPFRLYAETLTPGSPYSQLGQRTAGQWSDIVRAFQSSGILGHGTGTASLGLQYVFRGSENLGSGLYHVEGGYASVIWEWGIIGLLVWVSWSLVLLTDVVRRIVSLRNSRFFWLGLGIGFYVFFILFAWFYLGMQVYQNYITQAFLWLLVGVLFRLPMLAREPEVAGGAR